MQTKGEVSDVKADEKKLDDNKNNYSRVKCPDFTLIDNERYLCDIESREGIIFIYKTFINFIIKET
jgi:hypothetical protein